MAGSTIARTAHFALHRVALTASVSACGPVAASVTPVLAQKKILPMSDMPLFDVCDVWMGAMVPKRWAKRAVTRNAIKRQIHSVSDLAEPSLVPGAHVVRLRAGFDKMAYPSATSDALKAVVRQELTQLFVTAAKAVKASAGGAGFAAGATRGSMTQARPEP